ncbi:MAG: phosphonoacetaldehyde hydrolase [Planctomycetota bacterium]|nr:phosphonoacetaldehyde hydrolase [Planctomycetota bacterium]
MKYKGIGLVVFDLAGTVVDHGSRAPAGAFRELFRRHGIAASEAEAREPMGKHKRDHIADMLAMPAIAGQWREKYGRDWENADVDALFDEFLPLQLEALADYSEAIAGTAETLEALRSREVKTAATTGYDNAMTDFLLRKLAGQDIAFDFSCCAAEVAAGRPRPWMIFRCMEALDVFPARCVVNVGDTVADIEAGANAGVWSVGVSKTGNMTGLSREQTGELDGEELESLLVAAAETMHAAGADIVIESVAALPGILRLIARELELGMLPGGDRTCGRRGGLAPNRLLKTKNRPVAAISQR